MNLGTYLLEIAELESVSRRQNANHVAMSNFEGGWEVQSNCVSQKKRISGVIVSIITFKIRFAEVYMRPDDLILFQTYR